MNNVNTDNFSMCILKAPEGKNKGAIILSCVDKMVMRMPWLKELFYLIEARHWRGLNDSNYASIKLVEDLSLWEETNKMFPNAICLDISPADFVDTNSFEPLGLAKEYDGIQISQWSDFKRPELFTKATGLLNKRKFLKLGHFENGGTYKELRIRDKNKYLAKRLNANIDIVCKDVIDNKAFPDTKYEINMYINSAKIGILTSAIEGVNRFKMEIESSWRCWTLSY